MTKHIIEIDDTIWKYLQKHAEPLVDNANSVLHKLLLSDLKNKKSKQKPIISVKGLPKSLSQVLEVVSEMELNGYTRLEATKMVAERNDAVPTTIMDKYCRQLDLKAQEADKLLKEPGYKEFKNKLKEKFPSSKDIIDNFFESLLISRTKLD